MTPDPAAWPAAVVATAAAVAGLVYLGRGLRALFRKLEAMDRLLSRELEHNHGGSIKDDVHGIAVALGETQRRVDVIERTLGRVETNTQEGTP